MAARRLQPVFDPTSTIGSDSWKDVPVVLDLPTDRPRPPVQTYPGPLSPIHLDAELTDALRQLEPRHDCTLFMTLLAGFQVLLGRYARQDQVCVGTPVAGRDRSELEGLIGFFFDTLVLRGDLSADPTFEELLVRTREHGEAYAHQHLPLESLVDRLQPRRDLSRSPLFQTMFVLQNAPLPEIKLHGLCFPPLEVHSGSSRST